MNLHDDNSLMELVKNSDKEAYNEIVKKYRVLAISFAYSILSDLHTSEDVIQDVFINIYLKRENYRPVCEFKTFLYQSIRNKCYDYLRKNKIRVTVNIDNINELAESCSAEETFLQTEKEKLIFELMNGLKNDYKTALHLFVVDNVSYYEIGKIMKKTLPQVKILIFRARKKLKRQYREVFGDEK